MKALLPCLSLCFALCAKTTTTADVKEKGWIPPGHRDKSTITSLLSAGYRNDSQHLKFNSGAFFHFRNFNSLTMSARWIFDFEHIIVRFGGDYGWLIHGDCRAKINNGLLLERFPSFSVTNGYSADADAAIASRVKFWTFAAGSFSFIPALGYQYSHFNFFPEREHRSSSSLLTFSRPVHQDWFGPVYEGRLSLELNRGLRFDLYYQYIQIAFRQTLSYSLSQHFYNKGVLTLANLTNEHISAKRDSLRTQLGGADLSYRSRNHWQIGLHFDGSSTWTHIAKALIHTKTTNILTRVATKSVSKETLDISWLSYRVNLFGSYWF